MFKYPSLTPKTIVIKKQRANKYIYLVKWTFNSLTIALPFKTAFN